MHHIMLLAVSHDLCAIPVMLKKQFCFCYEHDGPDTGVHGGDDTGIVN